ncbi:MAG: thiamine biosynthesis protein ThiC [Pseudomonadota bacterium]
MELTRSGTIKAVAILLLLAAISQPIYTALYLNAPDVDRQILWGLEALMFVVLAALAGSALAMAKRYTLAFSAIGFAAVLNVVQVGVGLVQFGPARDASQAGGELAVLAGAIFAFSFFVYYAAKVLLGLAAFVVGMGKMGEGGRLLGGLTALVGIVAFSANTILMMFGRDSFLPSPVAGASGVVATLLLAICLFSVASEDGS